MKLIERLSPSEKRQFRLFVMRNNPKGEILFMQLFDYLDKAREYDEDKIIARIPSIKRGQLSNLKSNLYRQLLSSLRQQKRSNFLDIHIRENIDYALILHSKGMYRACLHLLDKVKKTALDSHKYSAVLMVLEMEKHVESLYITGSMYPKAKELRIQTSNVLDRLRKNHDLSNLSLSLYGLYLQYGYVKDRRDFNYITDFFRDHLSVDHTEELDFYGKLYYFQSHVWYYNMVQDFANNYKYAQRWVELFDENPAMIKAEMTQYIKALHNVLNPLFMAQRYDKFGPMYDRMLAFGEAHSRDMNRNELSNFKLIEYLHGINQFFLTGDFTAGVQYVKHVEEVLDDNRFDWDLNRILLFNYKIASIYFCEGDLNKTVSLLNRITNQVYINFREDIQCFARILNLIAHFELGNESLLTYQIRSTYRFLSRMEHLQHALKEILSFLRKIPSIAEEDLKGEFKKLTARLRTIEKEPFERRPFLYLDIISWLESKIEGIPVKEVIQRKIAARKN